MASREEIFIALRERMALVEWIRPGETKSRRFVTMARRVKLFSDVPERQQPACFQIEHDETTKQVTGMPYTRSWLANWIIYQATGKDKKTEGTIENNLILDAVEAALAPRPTDVGFLDERNTLGQLVHHCLIEGRTFKDPGDVDDQGMLIVPIKLLVP